MKNRKILIFVLTFVLVISTTVMPAFGAFYTVQSGDVLWEIAERYGVTIDEIVDFNEIEDRNLIFPGQKLEIPDNLTSDVEGPDLDVVTPMTDD